MCKAAARVGVHRDQALLLLQVPVLHHLLQEVVEMADRAGENFLMINFLIRFCLLRQMETGFFMRHWIGYVK